MIQTQMFTDDQILDLGFRKKIILEINGPENINRKKQQAAILLVLRDGVRQFVLQRLRAQGFKEETLAVMEQRAYSINILKKIVNKKARSYTKGVSRSVEDMTAGQDLDEDDGKLPDQEPGAAIDFDTPETQATEDIETVAEAMELSKAMRRADSYRKCAKNCVVYVYPDKRDDLANPGQQITSLCTKVYFPHLYDAIPDANDKEKMRCLILSPFSSAQASAASMPALNGGDGRAVMQFANPIFRPDGVNQTIANSPQDDGADKKKREYVWWTSKFHLTTNEEGEIIPEKTPTDTMAAESGVLGPKNPIQRMPAINLAEEQDGEFWALGGDDLMESTILLNLKLTDMESILHMQGWGQLVITGSSIKNKDFAVGPQVALVLDTDSSAEHPTDAKILQHDPHTTDHMKSAELLVALLLTTNNLSVKSVATNLEVGSVASAIAKMVDEADNMDDVSEDQQYYACKEKEILTIAEAWLGTLRGVAGLDPDLNATKPLQIAEMNTQFHNVEAVVTEQERLANLKLRKDLGIDAMVDLIKKDNPQLTDAQAEQKLIKNVQERVKLRALDPLYGADLTRGTITEQVGPGGKIVAPAGDTAAIPTGAAPAPGDKKPAPKVPVPGQK